MPVVDIALIALLAVALAVGLSRGFLATIGFFAGLALGASPRLRCFRSWGSGSPTSRGEDPP